MSTVVSKTLGGLAVVLIFGFVTGAAWSHFMVATATLPYANPLRIMVIGVIAGALAFVMNHSELVKASVPKHLRFIAGVLFGCTSMVMGWACTFTAFPSGETITDLGARIACALVAFAIGLYSYIETGALIRNRDR